MPVDLPIRLLEAVIPGDAARVAVASLN